MSESDTPLDGRRARRERSRTAIIDAMFALVADGKVPPAVDDIADRAGVSVSSVFRNFDGLADLQCQAFERFRDRFAHLFGTTIEQSADRGDRVARHVDMRIELFAAAGPLMHIARQRALDHEPMAAAVGHNRSQLADQARHHFGPEARQLGPADAANLIATLDTLTSPEAYEVMSGPHARTQRQIRTAWTSAITGVLTSWPGLTDSPSKEQA